jgi:hypothetical protein
MLPAELEVFYILQKSEEARSKSDLNKVYLAMRNISFFKKLAVKESMESIQNLCRKLQY